MHSKHAKGHHMIHHPHLSCYMDACQTETCRHSEAQQCHLLFDFISFLLGPGGLSLLLPLLALLALSFLLSTPACFTVDLLAFLSDKSSKHPCQDGAVHAPAKSCSANKTATFVDQCTELSLNIIIHLYLVIASRSGLSSTASGATLKAQAACMLDLLTHCHEPALCCLFITFADGLLAFLGILLGLLLLLLLLCLQLHIHNPAEHGARRCTI